MYIRDARAAVQALQCEVIKCLAEIYNSMGTRRPQRRDFLPSDNTGADLSSDKGLETAVIVSLFTDRSGRGRKAAPNEKN